MDGRIDWLPLPDMHSQPVFAALLDAENGGYLWLRPREPFTVTREYVSGTNVLATTFLTKSGSVRITDSLNTGVAGRLPWVELARRIDGLDGNVELIADVVPGTCLNTASPWVDHTVHGPVLRADGISMAVRTIDSDQVTTSTTAVTARYRTSPGSRQLLALVATEREPLLLPESAAIDAGVDRTIANWRVWSAECAWDGPFGEIVLRSALALKLLIYAPTGAIVAAATTSLPEAADGSKNWDYRYAWVRDMAYSLTALFRFGLREETHGAISWLLSTINQHGPDPHIFYQLDGSPADDEQIFDVPGWRGIGAVRRGNGAADQLQLGVFGDLFSIVGLYVDNGNVLDTGTGALLASIADTACDRWRSKDSGIWELEDLRHYTTSKLGCWQALTTAVRLAEIGQIPGDARRWRTEAAAIRDWVQDNAWSPERGAYVWYPGSDELDASILLHAISGFDRGARMRSTIGALQAELGAPPHLYRFSGADEQEAAFVACSFWMVSALHLTGQSEEAHQLLESLMDTTNDVGLLAEMVAPESGAFVGNLPQALSHLALIHAAITVATPPPDR
ncbi:GH15 family glucan-1,4-alpha-glucosidase [Nakamurella sp. UYEF19]